MKYKSTTGLLQWVVALSCVIAPSLPTSLQAQDTVPPSAASAAKAKPVTVVRDVLLEAGGRLQLRMLNSTGQPQSGQAVRCLFNNQVIASAKTSATGQIVISSLRPGLHVVAAGGTITTYRLWNKATAPPTAISAPAIVIDDEALLGQYGYGAPTMMAPGLLASGATLAAVVAVLAGKNSGSNSTLATPASP